MSSFWMIIRKGPRHPNPSWYSKQILDNFGISSKHGKILFGTQHNLYHKQYWAARFVRFIQDRGYETDIGPVIIHSYTDEDRYPGVIVTTNVSLKERPARLLSKHSNSI
jgi:hypothetical protein